MTAPRRLALRPAGAAYDVRRVLDWSAHGTVVAMQDRDGGVAVVELDAWRHVYRVGRAQLARFVPGGSVLAFAVDDAVHLVDMAAGWTRRSLPAGSVRALAVSPDGELLAVGGEWEVAVWRLGAATPQRLYAVKHESAFGLQLAVDAERVVAHVGEDPWGGAERCHVWSARGSAASATCELAPLIVGLEQPRRAALVADGATLVVTGHGKGGVAELVIIDVMSRRVHRRVVVGSEGYCGHVVATPDGARIVVEVGESNAPQRLVCVDGFGAAVKQVARVEWGLGGLWLAPDGGSVIYDVGSDLWRLDLRASARTRVLELSPPPSAVAASVLQPMGVIGVPTAAPTPAPTRTRAVLMAGRAIDSYLPRWGQVAELRGLAARRADGVCVIVAGDEVEYQPGEHSADEQVHARVVIGYPVAEADADLGPRGPVAVAEVRAALARAAQLDAFFWRKVSAILARTAAPFTAAQRRKSLSGASAGWYADVALDAAELGLTRDVVHLVPTGPLAHASLVAGVPGPMPPDDGAAPEELQLWHCGQDSRQEVHTTGVRGQLVARADAHGLGTDRVDLEPAAVTAELAAPGAGLYLIARYD